VVPFGFSAWPLFDYATEMAIRTSQAIIVGLGVALSLTGIVTGKFGLDAQLNHANIASAATWHDHPITDSERFWMNFPARYFVIAGVALLVTAIARAIAWSVRKSGTGPFPKPPVPFEN
jgi:hypothetical protein